MANNFLRNVLIGVGIGLLIAPMRGEELRKMIGERFQQMQGSLPENSQLRRYTQQVSDRVSQGAQNLKTYAQQASNEVQSSAGNLSNIATKAGSEVKQTGQDVADKTKQNVGTTQNPSTLNADVNPARPRTNY